jgi:hypothetical protein
MSWGMFDAQHKHQCPSCACVWEHPDACATEITYEAYEKAHTCPKCGEPDVKFKYEGRKQATCHDEIVGEDIRRVA